MATKRMLPHTATVFVETGENASYEMQYSVTVLEHVYCKENKSYQGSEPKDTLTVYMFDTTTTNFGSLDLKANRNEFIVPYDATGSTKPPDDARTIVSVSRKKAGSPRMWHMVVNAQ